ncbi:hypothetical protein M405DRAFT_827218 [Rhizopogon salebrosus TDB-379]|nr:hypothetical protein M405DRAFT_827218 [Rhizopogon salebrosus TDB-379]
MAATNPFTGYSQVDSFGPDEDYLSEENEVTYVTLDLGTVEPTLLSSSSTYRLVGLDSPTPFLQLSGSFFSGRHDTLIGSELLFAEGKNDPERNMRSLTHVGVTEQRIQFKEVQLREKSREQSGERDATPSSINPTTDAPPEDGGQALGRMTGRITEPLGRKRKKRRNKEKDVSPQEEGKDDAMDTT